MSEEDKLTMRDVVLKIKEQSLTKVDLWLVRAVLSAFIVFMGWNINSRVKIAEQMSLKADIVNVNAKFEAMYVSLKSEMAEKLPIKVYRKIEKQRSGDITKFVVDVKNDVYIKEEELERGRTRTENAMDDEITLGTSNL